ncbi:hypothetical protein [Nonlabens xiamenensis]|uniref:hypothetical protein n=1 Tax=Nonlabens xiamenensis TaxID=2341043 RepID=UPI000F60DD2E|nr:hypothetical protein [Nonlabens xiamenensis]
MLKSKKSLFVLIPLTLMIWGIIGYQIYDGLNPELPPLEQVDQSRFRESEKEKAVLQPLKVPIYDPFLGTRYTPKKTKQTIAKSSVINKKEVNWPSINYLGFIKKKDGKRKVAALQINGQVLTFEPRQTIDSIQLLSATSGYAELKYQGTLKRFEKN